MFRGSMVALVTPMTTDGAIDEQALEALVAFHIENGTDAIIAAGTTGESATLSHKENGYVVKRVVELVGGRIPVIAGTGSNSTAEAIELTQAALRDGADACLLVTPYYNRPPQEGLYQHYKKVAESVAIPQILYNVPGRTGCDLLPETVERLSHISNIIGIKEATGKIDRGREILERCGDRLELYSGDDPTARELILAGAKGNISVTANVAPALMHEMCMAALAGDAAKAAELDASMAELNRVLFLEPNPIPVKWAVHQLGFGSYGLRLPLVPLSEPLHAVVRAAMQQAGVLAV